jgi:hypothetical protein
MLNIKSIRSECFMKMNVRFLMDYRHVSLYGHSNIIAWKSGTHEGHFEHLPGISCTEQGGETMKIRRRVENF